MFVQNVQVGQRGHFLFCLPLNLDDHIFHVRTSFGVFLDSMKGPLSQDYFDVPVEGSGCNTPKYILIVFNMLGYFVSIIEFFVNLILKYGKSETRKFYTTKG